MVFNCHFVIFRVNVGCGPAEERLLLTGLHAVADIYCENCHTTLGWKYVSNKCQNDIKMTCTVTICNLCLVF